LLKVVQFGIILSGITLTLSKRSPPKSPKRPRLLNSLGSLLFELGGPDLSFKVPALDE
jgi:hypothetical protein